MIFFFLILNKVFKDLLHLKTRYLSFFKSFCDFMLVRFLLFYLVRYYKDLAIFNKVKLIYFFNLLLANLFVFFNKLNNNNKNKKNNKNLSINRFIIIRNEKS